MMDKVTGTLFLIVGFINFAPLIGVLGPEKLNSLYNITLVSPEVTLLMQHRAILFGIVGGLLIAASIIKPLRLAASIAGFLSMVSYIFLIESSNMMSTTLNQIAIIDAVALLLLVLAVAGHYRQLRKAS